MLNSSWFLLQLTRTSFGCLTFSGELIYVRWQVFASFFHSSRDAVSLYWASGSQEGNGKWGGQEELKKKKIRKKKVAKHRTNVFSNFRQNSHGSSLASEKQM